MIEIVFTAVNSFLALHCLHQVVTVSKYLQELLQQIQLFWLSLHKYQILFSLDNFITMESHSYFNVQLYSSQNLKFSAVIRGFRVED